MTKEEVLEWIESANYVEAFWDEYDDCGNRYQDLIFEKDDKFYKILFLNDEITTLWSDERKEHYYDIIPMVRKERMEYYYEEE
jgi:hypothetical protein